MDHTSKMSEERTARRASGWKKNMRKMKVIDSYRRVFGVEPINKNLCSIMMQFQTHTYTLQHRNELKEWFRERSDPNGLLLWSEKYNSLNAKTIFLLALFYVKIISFFFLNLSVSFPLHYSSTHHFNFFNFFAPIPLE